jgi:hypothetical protein
MALGQSRRGMTAFKAEELVEPTAIGTVDLPLTAGGTKQFRIFKDSWDIPVRHYIFPFDNDELNDPSLGYLPTENSPTMIRGRDAQDPEGTLMVDTWRFKAGGALSDLAVAFSKLVHRIPSPSDTLNPTVDQANDNIYSYRLRQTGTRGD